MNYIHQPLDIGPDELAEVALDNPAFVRLLDEDNFENYRAGREYHYHGGYATSPVYYIRPPHPGRWDLVIDLGGHAGRVRPWVRVLPEEIMAGAR